MERSLVGIRGWMLLVALGVAVTPFRIAFDVGVPLFELFELGYWDILTTPESELYRPFLGPFIIAESIGNSLAIIAWVYVGYLMFRHHKSFPAWYIGVTVCTVTLIIVDAIVSASLYEQAFTMGDETVNVIVKSLVGACIWIPYMLNSKRVKATFTRV
jgi:hypothetical protein